MNFSFSWLVLLFCGLTLTQDDGYTVGSEKPAETNSYFPDMCDLLRKFDAMSEKLSAMEIRLNDSETRLRDSENQIAELRNKERTKVIFSAISGGGDRAFGPFNTDVTLIYRKVVTNIGNAYSSSTGIFTAPVAGVYYFTFFHHAGGEHTSKLFLYKNNEIIVVTHDHPSEFDTADNGGNSVFLELQQGDQVYVRLPANSHVWISENNTTFSGFLVAQI